MTVPNTLLRNVSDCAQELDIAKNTDWGYLPLDEKRTYDEMTELVLSEYLEMDPELRELTMIAIVVATLVQNFVLTMQLYSKR
jgi:hypothetical protein